MISKTCWARIAEEVENDDVEGKEIELPLRESMEIPGVELKNDKLGLGDAEGLAWNESKASMKQNLVGSVGQNSVL